MKIRKLLPSVYSIVFGVGMIVFSFFYNYYFSAEKFYKLEEGTPSEYGMVGLLPGLDLSDTTQGFSSYYKIKFKESEKIFVLPGMGDVFDVRNLDSLLASGKKTGILFHDEKNEKEQFEVYKILQNEKEIYSFNKHFNSTSSKTIMWILLITGIVFVVLGIISFRIRRNEKEIPEKKDNF